MSDNERKGHTELSRRVSRSLAPVGLAVALMSGAAEIVAGPGLRLGLWNYRTGIMLFVVAGAVGGLGAAISLLAGIFSGPRLPYQMAVAGIIIGLVAAGIPWSWYHIAKQVPAIHDITTDTNDPPVFTAILQNRRDAENPAAYGGPAVAEQQNRAYPDIRPLVLSAGHDAVFNRALSVARDMGWKVAFADPKQGRIEATATTFWFGFKDDIVVRIAPVKEGSRVDVRSLSRVGVSDVGTNAGRVRAFLEKMKAAEER